MVTFNIHHGQMRCRAPVGTNDYQMVHIPKSPKGRLQMGSVRNDSVEPVDYVANHLGNVEVTFPKHVNAMWELGYPIYNGNGLMPVRFEDMLWPVSHPTKLAVASLDEDPYQRRIMEALLLRRGNG